MYNQFNNLLQKRYRIRQLTFGNRTGDAFGITVPQNVASQFLNIPLRLVISGDCFMFVRGENGKN